MLYFQDHPINAPSCKDNPWDIEFPEDLPVEIRSVDGVFNVFNEDEQKRSYQYPDLATFVTDMNILCNMIIDGPL